MSTTAARRTQAPPSGAQWTFDAGPWRGTIVEVGGGIRELSVDGRDVLEPFPLDAMCDGMHGTPLVPWPNRLGDGAYEFAGQWQQLPLTEPDRRTAIHGLTCWVPWRLVGSAPDTVVVGVRIHPQPGYPFDLEVEVGYRLDAQEGLTVRTTGRNLGGQPLPYACGQHPYLSPGAGTLADSLVQLPARSVLRTDARGLPLGPQMLRAADGELRTGRPVRGVVLDDTFTDLVRDGTGRAWTRLRGADGAEVALWQDAGYRYLEVFTGDTLGPGRRRTGLGVEPMTAPPDAFRSRESLTVLQPGEWVVSTWGVQLR